MKKITTILFISSMLICFKSSAQVGIDLEGSITIGQNIDVAPEVGSIRWTGTAFEGYTGSEWVQIGRNRETEIIVRPVETDIEKSKSTATVKNRTKKKRKKSSSI